MTVGQFEREYKKLHDEGRTLYKMQAGEPNPLGLG